MKVAQIRASFVLKGAKSLVRRKQVKNVCEKSWKQEAREEQQQQNSSNSSSLLIIHSLASHFLCSH